MASGANNYPSSRSRSLFYKSIACPPTLSQVCCYKRSCLSSAWYCNCFHLFPCGRQAYMDRARCFRCFKNGYWARDCASAGSSPRNTSQGTGFTPDTLNLKQAESGNATPPGPKQWRVWKNDRTTLTCCVETLLCLVAISCGPQQFRIIAHPTSDQLKDCSEILSFARSRTSGNSPVFDASWDNPAVRGCKA